MSKDLKDTSWQREFLKMKPHKPEDFKLLRDGSRGVIDAWKLRSLHKEYKRLKK